MDYANLVATISAMCAVYQTGKDIYKSHFSKFIGSPTIKQDAKILRLALMTYSAEEIEEIEDRIKGCRDRFIREGIGKKRARCLCSVLTDVKDGNGGVIPNIDRWKETYDQLKCASL